MLALLLTAAAQLPAEIPRGFDLRPVPVALASSNGSVGQPLTEVAFSADCKTVAVADRNTVRVLDAASFAERTRLHLPDEPGPRLMAFTPDGGSLLLVTGHYPVARWFDLRTGKAVRERVLPRQAKRATDPAVLLHPAGDWLFLPDLEADPLAARVLDPLGTRPAVKVPGASPHAMHHGLAVAGSRPLVVCFGNTGAHYQVWDMATGNSLRTLAGPETGRRPMADRLLCCSPDGTLSVLLLAREVEQGWAYTVEVWGVDDGRRRCAVPVTTMLVQAALSADNRMLVATDGSSVSAYDLLRGGIDRGYAMTAFATYAVAARDGKTLAVAAWTRSGVNRSGALYLCPFPAPPEPLPAAGDLVGEQVTECRAMLGSANEFRGGIAVKALAARPAQAVAMLADIVPEAETRRGEVLELLKALGADTPDVRDKAQAELQPLAHRFETLLTAALAAPQTEVRNRLTTILAAVRATPPPADLLTDLRAVEVLEALGTAEAKAQLAKLAGGAADSRLTLAAKAAVGRLGKR